MKNIAFITVRTASTRFPNKCLNYLGGISVIEHVIKRTIHSNFDPIVCTSVNSEDDKVEEICKFLEVKIFRGHPLNKIERWSRASQKFGIDSVHIIDADDPYFDGEECGESLSLLTKYKYDVVKTSKKSDAGFASCGTSITGNFLHKLENRLIKLNLFDVDVVPWDLITEKDDNISQMPDKVTKLSDIRLTLDYQEDLLMLNEIAKKFTFKSNREEIENFLYLNPQIIDINRHLNSEFIANKSKQLKKLVPKIDA